MRSSPPQHPQQQKSTFPSHADFQPNLCCPPGHRHCPHMAPLSSPLITLPARSLLYRSRDWCWTFTFRMMPSSIGCSRQVVLDSKNSMGTPSRFSTVPCIHNCPWRLLRFAACTNFHVQMLHVVFKCSRIIHAFMSVLYHTGQVFMSLSKWASFLLPMIRKGSFPDAIVNPNKHSHPVFPVLASSALFSSKCWRVIGKFVATGHVARLICAQ